jgi:nucleotide-binding universal stress UspA family protein
MYERIVMAYDGSLSGQKALLDCKEIAQWSRARLFLVAVMPLNLSFVGIEGAVYDNEVEERERRKYKGVLDEGLAQLAKTGHTAEGELLVGDAVEEIAKFAKKAEANLIIVGHKHLDSWAARWWRGSVSGALIERAPCSVLVAISP